MRKNKIGVFSGDLGLPSYRMNESHGLGSTRRKYVKTKMVYFRRFWVEELRHSETIFAKKRYTLIPLS